MNGSAYGAALLSAVVAENIEGLDDEQRELLPRFMKAALDGFSVPRIGLRYRLQTDVHGLDLSRHRLLEDAGVLVVELDVHGAPSPQVIGSIMAAARDGPDDPAQGAAGDRRGDRAAGRDPGAVPGPPAAARGAERATADGRVGSGRSDQRRDPPGRGEVGRGAVGATVGDGGARPRRGDEARPDRHPEALPPAPAHRAPGPRRRVGRRGRTNRGADRGAASCCSKGWRRRAKRSTADADEDEKVSESR